MAKDSKAMTCKDLVSFSTEVGNHDTRIDRCKRHEGRTIVFITLCAVLWGWRTWDEICEFGKYKKHEVQLLERTPVYGIRTYMGSRNYTDIVTVTKEDSVSFHSVDVFSTINSERMFPHQ